MPSDARTIAAHLRRLATLEAAAREAEAALAMARTQLTRVYPMARTPMTGAFVGAKIAPDWDDDTDTAKAGIDAALASLRSALDGAR